MAPRSRTCIKRWQCVITPGGMRTIRWPSLLSGCRHPLTTSLDWRWLLASTGWAGKWPTRAVGTSLLPFRKSSLQVATSTASIPTSPSCLSRARENKAESYYPFLVAPARRALGEVQGESPFADGGSLSQRVGQTIIQPRMDDRLQMQTATFRRAGLGLTNTALCQRRSRAEICTCRYFPLLRCYRRRRLV